MNNDVRTGGSGVLHHLSDGGSALSLEDYAIYMIVYSDNTATNVLIDELGMEAINALSMSLGASNTKLQRKMIQPEESVRGNENLSTPLDAARIMERIASCDLPMSESFLRPRPRNPGDLQRWAGTHADPPRNPGGLQAWGDHRRGHGLGVDRPA